MRNAKIVMLPWLSEVAAIVFNLFGTEFLFKISPDNVYQRCPFAIWGYITLMVYFLGTPSFWSTIQNVEGFNLELLPVLFFVRVVSGRRASPASATASRRRGCP